MIRYFLDIRCGCGAVRDKCKTEPDYDGLNYETKGVVMYRSGVKNSRGWEMPKATVEELRQECEKLNKGEVDESIVS